MVDIIWGNGAKIVSNNSFVLNVTHRKNGNREDYADTETIQITTVDLPGLSDNPVEWNEENLKTCVVDSFLKCEIEKKEESGILLAKVSHSGVGGY